MSDDSVARWTIRRPGRRSDLHPRTRMQVGTRPPGEHPPMSLETSRPRRGLCGYPIDAALVTRRSQRNEPEIAMTQEQGHPRYWDAVQEYSVAMSGPAATPGESGGQPWVAFLGFGPEMRARPDDGLIHLRGGGRFLGPRTLCGKQGRRRWKGSGRLCRECDALAGPPDRSPQRPDSN